MPFSPRILLTAVLLVLLGRAQATTSWDFARPIVSSAHGRVVECAAALDPQVFAALRKGSPLGRLCARVPSMAGGRLGLGAARDVVESWQAQKGLEVAVVRSGAQAFGLYLLPEGPVLVIARLR